MLTSGVTKVQGVQEKGKTRQAKGLVLMHTLENPKAPNDPQITVLSCIICNNNVLAPRMIFN